jgi:Na+-transporting NADH:ubiquinone oxidoreductase subunit C
MTGKESAIRTLLFALAVAFGCALVVSSVVFWLKPIQAAQESIERNRAIVLAAADIEWETEPSDRDIIDRYLQFDARLVEPGTGVLLDADTDLARAYDYRAATDDPESSVATAEAGAAAGLSRRPGVMPVFIDTADRDRLRVVLPVYGAGMWSTIHGFVCVEIESESLCGAWFYDHGETAGIGDRIQRPEWLALWQGKRVYRPDGTVGLQIGRSAEDPAYVIDGITGATVTVGSVARFVRYWLGDDGYRPVIEALRLELR